MIGRLFPFVLSPFRVFALISLSLFSSCGLLRETQPRSSVVQDDQSAIGPAEGTEEAEQIKLAFPVYFEQGRAELSPRELLVLDKIAEMMKKLPHVTAAVTGYRDSQEDGLSAQRVQYVINALISQSIVTERLTAVEDPGQINGERGRIDIMAFFSPADGLPSPSSGGEHMTQEQKSLSVTATSTALRTEEYQSFTEKAGYPEYKIGPSDVLEVTLKTRTREEKYLLTVKADGTISIPFAEPIKAGGLTPGEVEETLTHKLSGLYREVWINVLVKEYQSHKVTVLGAVSRTFPLQGKTSLLEAVAMVGTGLTGTGAKPDLTRVTVRRRDGSLLVIDITPGRAVANTEFVVDAGDVILVPVTPEVLERVIVLGDVRAPGVYPLSPSMTPLEAMAKAGGYTDLARLQDSIVIRGDLNHPQFIPVDVTKVLQGGTLPEQLYLRNEDIVYVPRTAIGNVYATLKPILELVRGPTDILVDLIAVRRF